MKDTERGFALPAAIGALVIVGVLVTAGFYMAQQELRIGVASSNAALAVNIAQVGANDVLINEAKAMAALPTWGDTTFVDTVAQGTWSVNVTKLNSRLFFLNAEGTVTKGGALWSGAKRSVGMVTRMNTADISPPAALTTQGGLKYGGSSEVHGIDEIPDGSSGGLADWTSICDSASMTNKPGILIDDTMNIQWNGNRKKIEGNMTGDPKYAQDTAISVESLMTFGDMTWDDMVDLADKIYTTSPGTIGAVESGGVCDTGVQNNWGDPTDPASPCFDYFPIIYLNGTGTFMLNSGIGQGILLVEGDLKVTGGFEFYGPVFVKGTLTTMGSGGHFWGGVVAANANIATNTVLGNAVITYSTCSVERALLNNSSLTKVRPLAMRSWVDLSNIVN
ncbi:MAG: hypothetical protein ACE5GJ_01870 [Gemmatimonadota bacterium]